MIFKRNKKNVSSFEDIYRKQTRFRYVRTIFRFVCYSLLIYGIIGGIKAHNFNSNSNEKEYENLNSFAVKYIENYFSNDESSLRFTRNHTNSEIQINRNDNFEINISNIYVNDVDESSVNGNYKVQVVFDMNDVTVQSIIYVSADYSSYQVNNTLLVSEFDMSNDYKYAIKENMGDYQITDEDKKELTNFLVSFFNSVNDGNSQVFYKNDFEIYKNSFYDVESISVVRTEKNDLLYKTVISIDYIVLVDGQEHRQKMYMYVEVNFNKNIIEKIELN